MVANFLAGGAAANAIAAWFYVPVRVMDCGVAPSAAPRRPYRHGAGRWGTANSAQGSAMSLEAAQKAVQQGCAYGAAIESEIVCYSEMGIANTSAATLLAHKLTGFAVADLVGRGTGLDNPGLAHKHAVLERAAARTGALSPIEALAEVGGFEIGTMAGAMMGAAGAGKLVVVDGFIATSAAVLASALTPQSERAFVYARCSAEHGHGALPSWLQAEPLLSLDMRLGEGTGALLAVPMIRAALSLFGMASFVDAGVSTASAASR